MASIYSAGLVRCTNDLRLASACRPAARASPLHDRACGLSALVKSRADSDHKSVVGHNNRP